jgi:hypothetical protein
MKHIPLFLLGFVATLFTYAQTTESAHAKKTEEIKALLGNLNDAIKKHDRPTLEKIYADEFLFVHGFGFIDNKNVQINGIMESDSVGEVPLPSFDQFYVYGDVAVLRAMTRNPVGGNNLMSTTIYAKKDGRWQIIQVQSTQQQRERKTVKVGNKLLDIYAGSYHLGGSLTTISRQGDTLMAQRRGRPVFLLTATADTLFFDKFGSSYSFHNDQGKISFTYRAQNGQEVMWKKDE